MTNEKATTPESMLAIRHLNIAWAILVVATGIGWWFGRAVQDGAALDSVALTGVIVTAFFKAWLAGFEFMELRGAPRWLRHGYDAWIVGVCAVLLWIVLA